MKKAFLAAGIVALSSVVAQAGVTLNVSAGLMFKPHSTVPINNASMLLLADLNGDGLFGYENTNPLPPQPGTDRDPYGDVSNANSFGGPNDLVVGRWRADDFDDFFPGTDSEAFNNLPVVGEPGGVLAPNMKLLLVWYDRTHDDSATGPGDRVPYGAYRDDSWVVPSNGGTADLVFSTEGLGGSLPDVQGQANFLTPEPTSALLLSAIGAGLLGGRGRKSVNA